MLQVGSLLDNKYKILSEVGHGGMSVVYLAINERANKTWAVKEVRKSGNVDYEAVRQGLIVETDMLKKLKHPHLPSIIDVIDQDDSFLIVMDYIEGKSLESLIRSSGAQSVDLVVEWGKQLCDVLGYLHSQQPPIIYRDMKPANVMLKPDGNVTLIDFGTAREFKDRAMVEDTTCLGTRGYAAPEQFGGRGQTDARTDIYCLGATMYHLITGHSPAEPPYEIKPLRYWDPNFADSGIEMVILKCCQQDPAHRYQNCAELLYDLENVSQFDRKARVERRRKLRAFFASVLLCLVGVGGIVGFSTAKNNATEETYSYYLTQASYFGDDIFSAESLYRQALNVAPQDPQAYEMLVQAVSNDGELTDSEQAVLLECIRDTGSSGGQENYRYLRDSDRAAFDSLWYNLGLMQFFMRPSAWEGGMANSTNYFKEVLDSEYLTSQQRELASACNRIGGYYQKLTSSGIRYMDTGDENTYETLWNDLVDIVSGDMKEKVGRDIYSVALYNHMGLQILKNVNEFNNVRITEAQMREQLELCQSGLENIRAGLTDSQKNAGMDAEVLSALETLASAKNELDARFQTRG